MQTWFITGCSTGFGRSLARAVLDRSWNVVVTARNRKDIQSFETEYPNHALALSLDVTDLSAIDTVVKTALECFGTIDVLANVAGYGYRSAIEEGVKEDIHSLFETNFYGPVALIQKVLPSMRKRKTGTIINFSSIAAIHSAPASGFYAASKSALESVSEALYQEVKPLGIHVMIVEPGSFATNFFSKSLKQSNIEIADYANTAGKNRPGRETVSKGPLEDPDYAVQLLIEALSYPNPPLRFPLGKKAVQLARDEWQSRKEEVEEWQELSGR